MCIYNLVSIIWTIVLQFFGLYVGNETYCTRFKLQLDTICIAVEESVY